MAANVERMAYRGKDPWWLGTAEDVGQAVKVERFENIWEAILTAGLDFKIKKVPLYVQESEGIPDSDEEYLHNVYHQDEAFYTRPKYRELEGVYQLVREGDCKPYGLPVGSQYTPLQIDEVGYFFDAFVSEGDMEIETLGILHDGRIWVQANWGLADEVLPDDEIKHYFLFFHGHGTVPVSVGDTIIRVECHNTLNCAEDEGRYVRLKHTKNIKENLDIVHDALDLGRRRFEFTVDQYKKLSEALVGDVEMEHLIVRSLNPTTEFDLTTSISQAANLDETFSTRTKNMVERIKTNVYEDGDPSLWGIYNGITKFLSHQASGTSVGRQLGQWLGDYRGNQNAHALELCREARLDTLPRYIKRADDV